MALEVIENEFCGFCDDQKRHFKIAWFPVPDIYTQPQHQLLGKTKLTELTSPQMRIRFGEARNVFCKNDSSDGSGIERRAIL